MRDVVVLAEFVVLGRQHFAPCLVIFNLPFEGQVVLERVLVDLEGDLLEVFISIVPIERQAS